MAAIADLGRGKAQKHLLTALHGLGGKPEPQDLTDLARGYRGHFGGLMSAARALTKRGLLVASSPVDGGPSTHYAIATHTHG